MAPIEIEKIFRDEAGRALATLIRLVGDFDLAEDALQDAFAVALERWPSAGVPENPGAWMTTAARHKAIDLLRRSKVRREETAGELREGEHPAAGAQGSRSYTQAEEEAIALLESRSGSTLSDDRLRLIFTCCHPALNREAQVALTLHTLGGLTTPEVARAFLLPPATLGQRLVRA